MATLLQDNVITSAGLAPAPTIKTVPQPQDTTNYAGITGGVTESIISDYTTLNNRLNSGEKQQTGTAQSILDAMNQLTGRTGDTQAANEAAGVNTETANLNRYAQQLADLNAQAVSLNREAQAIPLQVQEQNRNTGATDRGVAPQEAGALRLNALRALSIGQQSDIAAAAATGSQLRLQAAKDKAQQMVDLKYKPLEEALAIKQKQYELNKDILTSIDKKRTEALTVSLNKEAKDLEEAKAKEKAIQDILTTAGIQQAPQDLLARAQKAKTPSEAAMILGKYAGDVLARELKLSQIANSNASLKETKLKTDKLQQEINQAKGTLSLDRSLYPYGSKEYTIATILNSAGSDKPLDQDQRKSIASATMALNSVDMLTGLLNGKSISNTDSKNTFGDSTGIVQGRLRKLAASLGGDADAAAINAIITGLVPTVARGIFQEVGVLTDADIKNYRQTIPNLDNPANVNQLVSLILADTAQKMIGGTLTTAANNRQNVVGFKDDYLNALQKTESIRATLGQLSQETTSKLDGIANEVGVQGVANPATQNTSASGLLNNYMGIKPIQFNKN